MPKLEELAALDHAVLKAPSQQQTPKEQRRSLAKALAKRGNLKTHIGFSASAVLDLMRAQAQHANLDRDEGETSLEELRSRFNDNVKAAAPFALNAQLGEALRLEARDVFLSSASGGEHFHDNIERSVKCFTRALRDLQLAADPADGPGPSLAFGKASEYKAWILAHRGAALTSRIWILLVGGKRVDAQLYGQAEGDLLEALSVHPTYAWCRRFLAVLLTLRAQGPDLAAATELLDTSDTVDPSQQSSLQRSRALLSYMAANAEDDKDYPRSLLDRRQAARDAIEKAVSAVNTDPEDFMGMYIGAASLAWLYDSYASKGPGEDTPAQRDVVSEEHVSAAIDSAVTHAQNALSQATACLIGALKLRQKVWKVKGGPLNAALDDRIKALTTIFKSSQMDLETAAIILRDPNLADLREPPEDSDKDGGPLRRFTKPYCPNDSYGIVSME